MLQVVDLKFGAVLRAPVRLLSIPDSCPTVSFGCALRLGRLPFTQQRLALAPTVFGRVCRSIYFTNANCCPSR